MFGIYVGFCVFGGLCGAGLAVMLRRQLSLWKTVCLSAVSLIILVLPVFAMKHVLGPFRPFDALMIVSMLLMVVVARLAPKKSAEDRDL